MASLTAIENKLVPNDIRLLLQRITQGDERSFNLLFEQYRNQLFTYLFRITKSAETSEEIVLDIFLKIWHGREIVGQIDNFEAFLYRIAHNKAIDFLRSLKRNPMLREQTWEQIEEPLSFYESDACLIFKNTEAIFNEAVSQLSPQRQKVFHLHHSHGFTNQEIAERMLLSRNTVRNHLAASLEFIRKFMSVKMDILILILLLKDNWSGQTVYFI